MRNRILWERQTISTLVLVAVAITSSVAAYAVYANDLHFTRVLSGSMEPFMMEGDIAIIQDQPTSSIHAGDVVVLPAPDSEGAMYSHRLTDVQVLAGTTTVRTKGDHNPFIDPWELEIQTQTVPVVIGRLPLQSVPMQLVDPRNTLVLWLGLGAYFAYGRYRTADRKRNAALVAARDLGSIKARA